MITNANQHGKLDQFKLRIHKSLDTVDFSFKFGYELELVDLKLVDDGEVLLYRPYYAVSVLLRSCASHCSAAIILLSLVPKPEQSSTKVIQQAS
jgi:hypothetical protein